MTLEQPDRQDRYIPVPPPPPRVGREIFLAGLGRTDRRLPPPPPGCFLLAVPAAARADAPPQGGILLASRDAGGPPPEGEYLYAVVGGRLADAFFAPILEVGKGTVPAAAAAEIARLLRRNEQAVELGLALGGCRGSGLAYRLVMELVQAEEEAPEQTSLIRRAIALMEENFAHLYGVEELAQALEVSKSHLIRTFSAETGMTPGQYLTQIRVEQVKAILRAGGYTHEAAAAMTGFSGANYLCKVFRKQTGMTPGQYAQLVGGGQGGGEQRRLERLEQKLYL